MPTEWTTGSWFLDLLNWSVQLWNNLVNSGVGLITQDPQSISPSLWNIMEGINTGLQGVGYGLLLLFFLISLFKQTTNLKDFSIQTVFGYLLRFVGAKLAIDYCVPLMTSIIAIVMDAIGIINVSGANMIIESVPQNIIDMANGMSIFDIGAQLPLWLLSLIGVLVTCVCGILFLICVYGRFFRIYIHIALAPIGLASFGGETTGNAGKHFLRSFINVCLEAVVIMLSVVICKGIVSGGMFGVILGDGSDVTVVLANYIMQNLFAMVLLVTLTFGVNRLTKEMFGGM